FLSPIVIDIFPKKTAAPHYKFFTSICTRLFHLADAQSGVLVWTGESHGSMSVQYHPTDAILPIEPFEIFILKVVPTALSRNLLQPVVSCRSVGKHRDGAGILDGIRKSAPLRDGAKAVLIIFVHVIRIDCEHCFS